VSYSNDRRASAASDDAVSLTERRRRSEALAGKTLAPNWFVDYFSRRLNLPVRFRARFQFPAANQQEPVSAARQNRVGR
jgi:hypothetical protein